MSLTELRDALKAVVDNVWRGRAPSNASVPYAVWAEDQRADFIADGQHIEISWQGTIDYFTRDPDDPVAEDIEEALEDLDIAWSLNSKQYEHDTGVWHTEWVWQL